MANNNKDDSDCSKVILAVLAFLLPPLAVLLAGAKCAGHFWANVLLCCFFWIPGVLHALWYIFK